MIVRVKLSARRGGVAPLADVDTVIRAVTEKLPENTDITRSAIEVFEGDAQVLFHTSTDTDVEVIRGLVNDISTTELVETDDITVDTEWTHPCDRFTLDKRK